MLEAYGILYQRARLMFEMGKWHEVINLIRPILPVRETMPRRRGAKVASAGAKDPTPQFPNPMGPKFQRKNPNRAALNSSENRAKNPNRANLNEGRVGRWDTNRESHSRNP